MRRRPHLQGRKARLLLRARSKRRLRQSSTTSPSSAGSTPIGSRPARFCGPIRLEKQLEEIRANDEATEINELEVGSASLAFPVRLNDEPAGAALCLTSPAERFGATCEHEDEARDLTVRLAPLLF